MAGPRRVTLVLIEPFGWQRFTNLSSFVLSRVLQKCAGGTTPGAAEAEEQEKTYVYRFADERFHDNAAAWALTCFYNLNLLRIAGQFVEAGGARLIDLRYDVYGEIRSTPTA